MKKTICNLIALLFAITVYSQNNTENEYKEWKSSPDEYVNFDIGKYITPDIIRNKLDINFNLNSDYSHSNYNDNFIFRNDSATGTNYNFTGNIVSDFSRYVFTRKKITDFRISLSLNENYASQKYNRTSANYSSFTDSVLSANSLGIYWSNQWYFSELFFLNYGINSNISYSFTQNKIKNQHKIENQTWEDNQKRNVFTFDFSPRFGFGYGRIENVEDARQAVYIANALSKRNVLTRNLTDKELFELSQQISAVKNKRFLDSRLHLMDEISVVDSFFVKNDLLSNTGAAYFTTLYDMWQYGDLFSRKAGYEVYFLVYPYYTYNYLKYIPELQEGAIPSSHHANWEADLAFNYEKPVKLNWQHSVWIGGYAIFRHEKAGETDFKSIFSSDWKLLSAFTNYSLSYYPNTRTYIQATVGQQILKQIMTDAESTSYRPHFTVQANYYFSPYIRITGSYCINYYHYFNNISNTGAYNKSNNFSTIFNIQLNYSFF